MMNMLKNLEVRQDTAYALIRIYLGIALAVRGFILIANPESMSQLVADEKNYLGYATVAILHLAGGILLSLGLFTRFAALMLIPVLLGAVFVVHAGEGLMSAGQSIELAVLVLFLLCIYGVFGSGKYSVQNRVWT